MGKIYPAMASLLEGAKRRGAPRKGAAVGYIESRWGYLYSEMHAAGYAMGPQWVSDIKGHDGSTTEGLHNIIEKLCYLDVITEIIAESEPGDPVAFRKAISMGHARVQELVAIAMKEMSQYQQKQGPF